MEVREIYRLLVEIGTALPESTSKKCGIKMGSEQRRLSWEDETYVHSECRRGRGLTFQAGDRAHLGHFKNFYRAGMWNERHRLIDEICRRK